MSKDFSIAPTSQRNPTVQEREFRREKMSNVEKTTVRVFHAPIIEGVENP